MKARYFGTITAGLVTAGLLTALGNGIMKYRAGELAGDRVAAPETGTTASAEALKVDRAASAAAQRLVPLLAGLPKPHSEPTRDLNLKMFGFSQHSVVAYQQAEEHQARAAANPFSHYSVSLTYVSEDHRYAVVDGRLVQEGQPVSPGVYLRRVQPKQVLMGGGERSQWLQVSNRRRYTPPPTTEPTAAKSASNDAGESAKADGSAARAAAAIAVYKKALQDTGGQLR